MTQKTEPLGEEERPLDGDLLIEHWRAGKPLKQRQLGRLKELLEDEAKSKATYPFTLLARAIDGFIEETKKNLLSSTHGHTAITGSVGLDQRKILVELGGLCTAREELRADLAPAIAAREKDEAEIAAVQAERTRQLEAIDAEKDKLRAAIVNLESAPEIKNMKARLAEMEAD